MGEQLDSKGPPNFQEVIPLLHAAALQNKKESSIVDRFLMFCCFQAPKRID